MEAHFLQLLPFPLLILESLLMNGRVELVSAEHLAEFPELQIDDLSARRWLLSSAFWLHVHGLGGGLSKKYNGVVFLVVFEIVAPLAGEQPGNGALLTFPELQRRRR